MIECFEISEDLFSPGLCNVHILSTVSNNAFDIGVQVPSSEITDVAYLVQACGFTYKQTGKCKYKLPKRLEHTVVLFREDVSEYLYGKLCYLRGVTTDQPSICFTRGFRKSALRS